MLRGDADSGLRTGIYAGVQRAPNDQGVHPPFDRDRLLESLDDETRALALAHPCTGAAVSWERPAPADMHALYALLRRHAPHG